MGRHKLRTILHRKSSMQILQNGIQTDTVFSQYTGCQGKISYTDGKNIDTYQSDMCRTCLTCMPTLSSRVMGQVRAEAWAVASKMVVRVRDGQGLTVSDHFGLSADLTLALSSACRRVAWRADDAVPLMAGPEGIRYAGDAKKEMQGSMQCCIFSSLPMGTPHQCTCIAWPTMSDSGNANSGNANATTAVRGLVRSPSLGSFHASASRARRERVGTGPRLSPSRRVCAAC